MQSIQNQNSHVDSTIGAILSCFAGPPTVAYRDAAPGHPGNAALAGAILAAEDAIDPSRSALPTVYVGNELSNQPLSSPGEDAGDRGRTDAPALSCGSMHDAWVSIGRRVAGRARNSYVVHTAAAPIEWDYLADSERMADGKRKLLVQTVRMTAEMEAHVLASIGQVLTQTRITLDDGTRAYLPAEAAIALVEQIGALSLRNLHDVGEAEAEAAMNPE